MQSKANIYFIGMRNDLHNRQAKSLLRVLIFLWHILFCDTYLYG